MDWTATVLASSAEAIILDESAFFPGGGGQPADVGQLEWAGVFTRIDGVSAAGLVLAESDPLPARHSLSLRQLGAREVEARPLVLPLAIRA